MNKSVMNAIELLSVQYNFSVEDAVNILTMNNKKSRSKAKIVEPKREVEDLFAQLVNDAEDTFDVAVKEALDKNPIRSIEEDNELQKRNEKVLENICKKVDGEFVYKSETSESTDKKKTKKTAMTAEEKEAAAEAKKQEKLAAAEAKKAAKELEKAAAAELKKLKAEEAKKEKMVKEMEKLKAKELAKIKPTKEELAKKKEEEKLAAAEAKKAAKEQEKLAKEEAKKAAAEAKKKAPKAKAVASKPEPKVETKVEAKASEETPVKVTVKRIKIGDQEYLKSQSNILYNPETKEEVGIYDEATGSIKPLPDDDEEELEEDNYSM